MFDSIVVGLGAMGSATLFELAKRGAKVLGLEQFASPHAHGSTHGESRIIRQAYFEGTCYVPLLLRAYELWEELERLSGRTLFVRTGGFFSVRRRVTWYAEVSAAPNSTVFLMRS